MAFNLSSLNAYVEENKTPLIAASVLKGNTVSKFSLMTGVKGAAALNIISTTPALQEGDCNFSPEGDTKFTQRKVDTFQFKVNMEWCEKDLLAYYTQYAVRAGLADDSLAFEEYITKQIVDNVQAQLEKEVWQGGKMTGINQILRTAGAKRVTFNEGASAYEAVKEVYMAIPEKVLDKAVIFCGMDTFRQYTMELAEKNLYHYSADGAGLEIVIPATNTKLVAVAGLNGTKVIVAGAPENFYFATDMLSDSEVFDIWYSKDHRTYRLAVEFNAGVQVAFPDEVVLGQYMD